MLMSLNNRVLMTVGIHNCEYHTYWAEVFDLLGMEMGSSLRDCLCAQDKVKEKRRQYKQMSRVKQRQSAAKTQQIVEYVKRSALERSGMVYSPGMAFCGDSVLHPALFGLSFPALSILGYFIPISFSHLTFFICMSLILHKSLSCPLCFIRNPTRLQQD